MIKGFQGACKQRVAIQAQMAIELQLQPLCSAMPDLHNLAMLQIYGACKVAIAEMTE